jgi:hypothetical protein
LQELLSLAVVLKGRVGVMEATTVSLDDQAGVAPEEVRFEVATADVERDVDLWGWKSGLTAHSQEQPLQFAASPSRLGMKFVKDETKPRDTAPTTTTPKQRAQCG